MARNISKAELVSDERYYKAVGEKPSDTKRSDRVYEIHVY